VSAIPPRRLGLIFNHLQRRKTLFLATVSATVSAGQYGEC